MLGTLVNAKTFQRVGTQGVVGQHALYSLGHGKVTALCHQFFVLYGFQAAYPAGVAVVVLVFQLVAGKQGFVAVDDNDMVASIHIGCEGGLVFAPQQDGCLNGNAAKGFARGVQQIPFALYFGGLGKCGAHLSLSSKQGRKSGPL